MLPIKIMQMGSGNRASLALLGSTVDTNTGNKVVAVTPAIGQLIVVFAGFTGTIPTTVTDDQGGTYTKVSGSGTAFFIRDALVASAVLHTITSTQSAASTGGFILAFAATGMVKTGATANRSTTSLSHLAGATPSVTLSTLPLVENPLIGVVLNDSNPAAITPRTGYAEVLDTGYATPTTGIEAMTLDSGETTTVIAWGGTSVTAGTAFAIELDSSP